MPGRSENRERAGRGRRKLKRLALCAGLGIALSGCTSVRDYFHNGCKVGPNYQRPSASIAEKWLDTDDPRVHSEAYDSSHWWTVFNDPILDNLVQNAYRQNLPLQEAAFRVLKARAELGYSLGNLFPQAQSMDGQIQRKGISETIANRQFTPQRWFNLDGGGFNLSWEIDFWGRYRRNIEAARGEFNATIEDYDAILVILISDVANAYAQLRTLQAQLAYTRTNLELQKKTLDLVTIRFNNGAVSKLDVTQATTNMEQTAASIPPLEIQIRQTCNGLCVLLGIPTADLEKELGAARIPTAAPEVAVGIPAELLRRRPDVRRAERHLAAQCAKIGVATSMLYPHFYINGSIGYLTSTFKDMFNDQSIAGTIGPAFQWNILNYGRLWNNIRVQQAIFQEYAAHYRNRVLKANKEAENGLVAFLKSQEQVKAQARCVAAATESVELVLIQYKEGKVDFNRVFLLERELVQRQTLLAQAQGNIAFGLINLYKALGGGWEIRLNGDAGPSNRPPAEAPPPIKLPEPNPPDIPADKPKKAPMPDGAQAVMPASHHVSPTFDPAMVDEPPPIPGQKKTDEGETPKPEKAEETEKPPVSKEETPGPAMAAPAAGDKLPDAQELPVVESGPTVEPSATTTP